MASRDQRRSGVCRIADWARAKGIDDQDGKKLDNEAIDVEYVAMASYFDELSADDKRNLRNDDNLRRLLALAPNVLEMREPEAGADSGRWRCTMAMAPRHSFHCGGAPGRGAPGCPFTLECRGPYWLA
jgi:hypothetical protein